MEFSQEQKLIIAMLADISKSLKVKGDIDAELVSEAVWGGNEWAISMEYGFLFPEEDLPEHVRHVINVLDMWSFIEQAYSVLSAADKKAFHDASGREGKPKWPGFDGNGETDQLSAARFLIKRLRRFTEFDDGRDFNSHFPTEHSARVMLEVFEPLRATLDGANKTNLSVDDLIAIFQAAYVRARVKA